MIHTREAWDDTWRLLEEHWVPAGLGGIMHCFSGDADFAEECRRRDYYLGFTGSVTYPKSEVLREVAGGLRRYGERSQQVTNQVQSVFQLSGQP